MFNLNSVVTRIATKADFPQTELPAVKPYVLFRTLKKWAIAICVFIAFATAHHPAALGQTMPEGTIGWWAYGASYQPDPVSACSLTAQNHMGSVLVKMVPKTITSPGYDCWYNHFINAGVSPFPYGSTYLYCEAGYAAVWPGICVRKSEPPRPVYCSNNSYAPTVGNPVVVTTGVKY